MWDIFRSSRRSVAEVRTIDVVVSKVLACVLVGSEASVAVHPRWNRSNVRSARAGEEYNCARGAPFMLHCQPRGC